MLLRTVKGSIGKTPPGRFATCRREDNRTNRQCLGANDQSLPGKTDNEGCSLELEKGWRISKGGLPGHARDSEGKSDELWFDCETSRFRS